MPNHLIKAACQIRDNGSAATLNGASLPYKWLFDTTDFNEDSAIFTPDLANERIEVERAGEYEITAVGAHEALTAVNGLALTMAIYKNGSLLFSFGQAYFSSAIGSRVGVAYCHSRRVTLAANDYIEVFAIGSPVGGAFTAQTTQSTVVHSLLRLDYIGA